jgi:hypothetical protein
MAAASRLGARCGGINEVAGAGTVATEGIFDEEMTFEIYGNPSRY